MTLYLILQAKSWNHSAHSLNMLYFDHLPNLLSHLDKHWKSHFALLLSVSNSNHSFICHRCFCSVQLYWASRKFCLETFRWTCFWQLLQLNQILKSYHLLDEDIPLLLYFILFDLDSVFSYETTCTSLCENSSCFLSWKLRCCGSDCSSNPGSYSSSSQDWRLSPSSAEHSIVERPWSAFPWWSSSTSKLHAHSFPSLLWKPPWFSTGDPPRPFNTFSPAANLLLATRQKQVCRTFQYSFWRLGPIRPESTPRTVTARFLCDSWWSYMGLCHYFPLLCWLIMSFK